MGRDCNDLCSYFRCRLCGLKFAVPPPPPLPRESWNGIPNKLQIHLCIFHIDSVEMGNVEAFRVVAGIPSVYE